MSALAGWETALGGSVGAVALHGLRLVPAAVLCPFLGGPLVPAGVRAALAFGLGGCAWLASGGGPYDAAPLGLLVAAAREVALGVALAFIATVPFDAARAAGRLVDTLRGATLADLHVAPLRQRESASGDLLVQWTVVLGSTSGGGRLVVMALLDTFRSVPVGTGGTGSLVAVTIRGAGELVACALAVGAPAAAGVLAADLVLAAVTRAAPQLQISSAAQPARAGAALLALLFPAAALAGRLTSSVALSSSLLHAFTESPRP